MALGRDRRTCTYLPDVLAEGMAGVAAITDNPPGHTRQPVEQGNRMGQFMGLTWCQPEGDGTSAAIRNHASLGPIAAT